MIRTHASFLTLGFALFAMSGCASMGEGRHDEQSTIQQPVRDAIAKVAGSNKVKDIDKEEEDGKVEYEAHFVVDGVEHTVSVDETGALLEEETELKVADLPRSVSSAVLKAQPLAVVKSASIVKKSGESDYEIDAKVGKDKHEILIASDGRLISDKVEPKEKDEDHDDSDHRDWKHNEHD